MARHEIKSSITGSVWIHSVGVGQRVFAGNTLLVLESMKMEIPVETPVDGEVVFLQAPGTIVNEGDVVAAVESV